MLLLEFLQENRVFRALPLLLFIVALGYQGNQNFFIPLLEVGSHYDLRMYNVSLLYILIYFIFLNSLTGLKALKYLYIILCFFIIQSIVYHIFSRLLMVHDSFMYIWLKHLPWTVSAFLFMQFLLVAAKVSWNKIIFGNILVIMVVLASTQRIAATFHQIHF